MMEANTVKLSELRTLFADTEGRLDRLVASGRIKETGPGQVGLVEAVTAFLSSLRADLAARSATASAETFREARATASELRLAEQRRDLIPIEEADLAVTQVVGAINSTIASIPARSTRDVRLRRRLEEAVFKVRSTIAEDVGSLAHE
jgi:hypothetical protein